MHRALLVSEVLLEIFQHVNVNSGSQSDIKKPTLNALARTCKTFHEPAMDLLWAELSEITPLLGCIPRLHRLIYRSGSRHSWSLSWHSNEPLSEHEARQFLRHAARVRSLHTSFDAHFEFFSVLPIETCVFPKLLSLSFMDPKPQSKYLFLFLSPTLRRCNLVAVHPDLKSIATRCVALEDLSILYPYDGTGGNPAV
ncbi:hypothetical protein EDB19DRAFT_2036014 [Suillus lakei]|nr:hypothetical protein EDB19DRAFT_2036014 [Suillus lakei]